VHLVVGDQPRRGARGDRPRRNHRREEQEHRQQEEATEGGFRRRKRLRRRGRRYKGNTGRRRDTPLGCGSLRLRRPNQSRRPVRLAPVHPRISRGRLVYVYAPGRGRTRSDHAGRGRQDLGRGRRRWARKHCGAVNMPGHGRRRLRRAVRNGRARAQGCVDRRRVGRRGDGRHRGRRRGCRRRAGRAMGGIRTRPGCGCQRETECDQQHAAGHQDRRPSGNRYAVAAGRVDELLRR
jgi:hypothetical protein